MIHILYLASGSGRRFGSNKLLAEFRGKPVFRWGLDTLLEVQKSRSDCAVLVVSRYEEIRNTAKALGLSAVDNPDSDKGISHTIRAGLNALTVNPGDYFLFAVADQPHISGKTVENLLDEAKNGVLAATAAFGEREGNPALFSADLLPELLALEGDRGGRKVLKNHPGQVRKVQVAEETELFDVDTPADMK